ncbi:unnamed protein product [Sympodiomycopsis kandeliae]
MVSFNCDACNDVVKKPKLDQHHNQRCGSSFTCLDCSLTFYTPNEWKPHNTCISEAQKYERSVYRGEKGNKQKPANANGNGNGNGNTVAEKRKHDQEAEKADKEEVKEKKEKKNKNKKSKTEEQPPKAAKEVETTLQSRLTQVVKSSGSSLSLAKVVEQLSKSEKETDEKKLRKEVLKNIIVDDKGQLSWSS